MICLMGVKARTFLKPTPADGRTVFSKNLNADFASQLRMVFVSAVSSRGFAFCALVFRNVWHFSTNLFCSHLVSSGLQKATFYVVVMNMM